MSDINVYIIIIKQTTYLIVGKLNCQFSLPKKPQLRSGDNVEFFLNFIQNQTTFERKKSQRDSQWAKSHKKQSIGVYF